MVFFDFCLSELSPALLSYVPVMITNTSSANCYVALSMSYINAVQIGGGGGGGAVAHVLSIADIIA